jgi:hypothetical protein
MMCAPIRPNWPATLIFWVSDSDMRFFFRDDATTRLLIPSISKLCQRVSVDQATVPAGAFVAPRRIVVATDVAASALRIRQRR